MLGTRNSRYSEPLSEGLYYPLTLAALGHPSVRAVLQMPPLNLGTVSLFAKRDPRNQTAETTGGGQSRTKACWEVIVQL